MDRVVCDCGNTLFFENWKCLQCSREVGYDPSARMMLTLEAGNGLQRCANGIRHGVCNWLVWSRYGEELCLSCRLNRTIPDLKIPKNVVLWGRMEAAKRRLICTFLGLGIPLTTMAENPRHGLAFDIVSVRTDPTKTMGHLNGVITVNLEEADDTYRQINREQLGESSRTLLGHFRHESGHFIWQRWVNEWQWDDVRRTAFRERFGDERADYTASLKRHYKKGAPADWEQSHISAYATSHPWEDWAETWAHYLQIVEALETAEGLGLETDRIALPPAVFPPEAGELPSVLKADAQVNEKFLVWLGRWASLSTVLNEISASLGQPALYPYILSKGVAQKLRLIQSLVGKG
jgi:hypothetical protein